MNKKRKRLGLLPMMNGYSSLLPSLYQMLSRRLMLTKKLTLNVKISENMEMLSLAVENLSEGVIIITQ